MSYQLCCVEADARESGRDNRDVDIDDSSYDVHVPGRVVLNLWRVLCYKVISSTTTALTWPSR